MLEGGWRSWVDRTQVPNKGSSEGLGTTRLGMTTLRSSSVGGRGLRVSPS